MTQTTLAELNSSSAKRRKVYKCARCGREYMKFTHGGQRRYCNDPKCEQARISENHARYRQRKARKD